MVSGTANHADDVVAAANDDFHYPSEEPAERRSAEPACPALVALPHGAGFLCPGAAAPVAAAGGGSVTCASHTWQVHAVWPDDRLAGGAGAHVAALEVQFARWGLLAFASSANRSAEPIFARKSVGSLGGIKQPWFNLTAGYLQQATTSLLDVPAQLATNGTIDGEPDYPSMASTLAPQRDTAAISHAADVVKFAVAYSGRVKCGSTGVLKEDSVTGGIAELQDLRAPLPDPQKVIFDPPHYLKFWPSAFANTKTGLVGGHLGVANVGSFSAGVGGFELLAFGPVPPHEDGGVPPPFPYSPTPPPPAGSWECAKPGPAGTGSTRPTCLKNNNTWSGGANGKYPGCATCYCCQKYAPSPPAPRLPNINYNPGAFVALRDETAGGGTVNGTRYFYATNQTTKELPTSSGAASFYKSLLAVYKKDAALVGPGSPAMKVELPDGDRRQVDMAHAALLATTNNFVGDQPNYGFGSTYWSYGREDNGSLPLDILPIDNALMSWGICDIPIKHIGFWLDNYIAADGHVVYFSGDWIAHPDSISDLGRIIDMFLNAVKLCHAPAAWQQRHLPTVESIGQMLLRLRSQAPKLQNASKPIIPLACVYDQEHKMTFLAGNSKGGKAPTLAAAKLKCDAAEDCGGITEQYGDYECRQSSTPAAATQKQPANSWPLVNAAACGHATAAAAGPATAGLIIGAPEHGAF